MTARSLRAPADDRRQTYADVIRAAVPDASSDECNHILWERTPHPMGRVTARDLFRAASRYRRAAANGIRLCELCDNRAERGWTCDGCRHALARAAGIPVREIAPARAAADDGVGT